MVLPSRVLDMAVRGIALSQLPAQPEKVSLVRSVLVEFDDAHSKITFGSSSVPSNDGNARVDQG